MRKSVSVIVCAYNEQNNIAAAVKGVIAATHGTFPDYEVIVVDDGSSDNTSSVAQKLAKRNRRIRVHGLSKNSGFGASFKKGISLAKKTYIAGFPGDNDMSSDALKQMFKKAGEADLVISYMANPKARSWFRRSISRAFVLLMNALFCLKLNYYNGHFVVKASLLKKIPLSSDGVTILAEVKIRLLKKGVKYVEVPFEHTGRAHGSSKAFSLKSIIHTASFITTLLKDIYLR